MKKALFVLLALILVGAGVAVLSAPASAPDAKPLATAKPDPAALRAGHNFIPTPAATTEEEDLKLLELFKGLRVADVVDGMDAVGLQDIGLMSSEIKPLWRDTERYAHRIVGIAVTARYVPTNRPPAGLRPEAEFDKWVGQWYKEIAAETFTEIIRKGAVVVIEGAEGADVGPVGSNNILDWKLKGCLGVVTNTTARDTDEIATEKVPLYYKQPGRGIRPGRIELESVNRPVSCGGALVVPGDVIVADGDGVVVVPRAKAEDVARYARKILDGDKRGRRGLYQKLGLPEDDSVR
jgi:4-hydroxy-4-methyl-2-oxoglutarate aldolase